MRYAFNRYYLTKHLTRIGMRDIYLAYPANEPERTVTLKVFDEQCLDPAIIIEEFWMMGQRLQQLVHPHIVPFLDLGIEEGKPYAVSKYQTVGSLRLRLDSLSDNRLPLDDAVNIVIQVGQALAFAHTRNLLHQNIKPENIFLNEWGEALLADFSLRSFIHETERTRDLRTLSYMAPEQRSGFISAHSDQYALGCLLYELITGTLPPLIVKDLPSFWQSSLLAASRVSSKLAQTLPGQLKTVMLRVLADKPGERYEDVSAFLAGLTSATQPKEPEFPFSHLTLLRQHQPPKPKAKSFMPAAPPSPRPGVPLVSPLPDALDPSLPEVVSTSQVETPGVEKWEEEALIPFEETLILPGEDDLKEDIQLPLENISILAEEKELEADPLNFLVISDEEEPEEESQLQLEETFILAEEEELEVDLLSFLAVSDEEESEEKLALVKSQREPVEELEGTDIFLDQEPEKDPSADVLHSSHAFARMKMLLQADDVMVVPTSQMVPTNFLPQNQEYAAFPDEYLAQSVAVLTANDNAHVSAQGQPVNGATTDALSISIQASKRRRRSSNILLALASMLTILATLLAYSFNPVLLGMIVGHPSLAGRPMVQITPTAVVGEPPTITLLPNATRVPGVTPQPTTTHTSKPTGPTNVSNVPNPPRLTGATPDVPTNTPVVVSVSTATPKPSVPTATLVPTATPVRESIFSVADSLYASAELSYTGSNYGMLRARTIGISTWEQFLVQTLPDGNVSIQSTVTGLYVTTEVNDTGNNYGMLRARSATVGGWEEFRIQKLSDGNVSIQSAFTDLYVSAELSYTDTSYATLRARSATVGGWEEFLMVQS